MSIVPDSTLRDFDQRRRISGLTLPILLLLQQISIFKKLSFFVFFTFCRYLYGFSLYCLFAMSRWNMRAVALEGQRQRRDDTFIGYDDGDGFWWSSVCLIYSACPLWLELTFQ